MRAYPKMVTATQTLKRAIIFLTIIGIMGIVTSCSKPNATVPEIDSEKRKIAEKLMSDFKDYNSKAEQSFSRYNLVMASDRANGILGAFRAYFTEDELSWVAEKNKIIKGNLHFSTVYSGYSKSGLHIIALTRPTLRNNLSFADAMNAIRGDENEKNLLFNIGIFSIYSKGAKDYYALDLFIEDLLNTRKSFSIDDVLLTEDKRTKTPIKKPQDKNLDTLLTKYQREINDGRTIANKGWKLYLFEEDAYWPEIKIICEGEEITLHH